MNVSLPNSALRVSRLGMGCWQLAGDATWGPQSDTASIEAVQAALDGGINFFDTAELYGNGLSEQVLGRALKGRRDRAVIASKVASQNLRPPELAAACERSLANLGTDHIDLYQIHWPSREIPLAESWGAMEELKRQGKVRAIGVSNFGPADMAELLASTGGPTPPAANQLPYNLLARGIEHAVLPLCIERGVGVITYSALMWGLLADKYLDADEVPAGRARTRHFACTRPQSRHGESGCEETMFEAIAAVRRTARALDVPMSRLAIAWLLAQRGITSVLVGLRSRKQVEANLAAMQLKLSDEVLAALDAATQPVKQAMGENLDLWEPAERSRFR